MKSSFVVPTYREELNIINHYKECVNSFYEVQKIFPKYREYEYLVIDNCSDDKTVEKVLSIRKNDKNVKLYVNDKNYGPVLSPFEGLKKSTGDLVLLIAADLQEPPTLLSDFVEAIEEGYEAGIGLKKKTKENIIMWNLRGIYYLILKALGLVKVTSRFSGFGLYTRELIVKFLDNQLEEPSLRILLPIKTKNIKSFQYDHQERRNGQSSYNLYDYAKEALKTIIRNSTKISSIANILSLLLTFISLLMIPITILTKLFFWEKMGTGVATIIVSMLIFNSGLLLLITLVLDRQGQILKRLKPKKIHVKHKEIYD